MSMISPFAVQTSPVMPLAGGMAQAVPNGAIYQPVQKQELSVPAAVKTGTIVGAGFGVLSSAFKGGAIYGTVKRMLHYDSAMETSVLKSELKAIRGPLVAVGALFAIAMTAVGALVGASGASLYNYFVRQEKSRPYYLA